MDWRSEISRTLGFGGGLHFATTFLLERWRKNNHLQPINGVLQYPKSTTDKGTGGTGPGQEAGIAFTLYSIDDSFGTDVALSAAAALLSSSSGAAGTSMPSTSALAGGYGSIALPLTVGFLVGNQIA
jgi:hypothetical protein